MEKKIDKKQVEHVARLARLGVTSGDTEKFSRQLNDILTYMEKLAELEVEEVAPMSHVLPLKNVFRKDIPRPGLDRSEVLGNAPEAKGG